MNESDEYAEDGTPIFRYEEGEKPFEVPQGEMCLEEISDHIEKHIGEVAGVFHEMISDTVHIDLHIVKATPERPYHVIVTSGMSDLPMNVPGDIPAPKHTELVVCLPQEWSLNNEDFEDERVYWPLRQLKFLARFPHKYDTWLSYGHTIPNGDPAEPYADNTELNGVIILPPVSLPPEFQTLRIDEDKEIHFFAVVPLYEEEMNFKLSKGSDDLLDLFDEHGIDERIDIRRKNVAKRKKLFGLF